MNKTELVKRISNKIGLNIDVTQHTKYYNPITNGTVTKDFLQETCKHLSLPIENKKECAKSICNHLQLNCNYTGVNRDYNPTDGTISAGFLEKVLAKI